MAGGEGPGPSPAPILTIIHDPIWPGPARTAVTSPVFSSLLSVLIFLFSPRTIGVDSDDSPPLSLSFTLSFSQGLGMENMSGGRASQIKFGESEKKKRSREGVKRTVPCVQSVG